MAAVGEYKVIQDLGSGGFANVKLGLSPDDNGLVALKIMDRSVNENPAYYELVMNEVESLKQLDHQNIIKLIDY